MVLNMNKVKSVLMPMCVCFFNNMRYNNNKYENISHFSFILTLSNKAHIVHLHYLLYP